MGMGRAFLSFLATIGLIIPISMSPGPAMGQDRGTDRIFANNDCRGDLESGGHIDFGGQPHTGRGATDQGGGNNNGRGREFAPFPAIAGNSPNETNMIFGNNNGKCVTLQ